MMILTGPLKVLLLPLKIKDNVDHVGLSLQLDLLKELLSSLMEILNLSLNNNLLIVQPVMEIMAAKEV